MIEADAEEIEFLKVRRQRRKRTQILRARARQQRVNSSVDSTVPGSLPGGDSAETSTPGRLAQLLQGVEGIDGNVMRALRQNQPVTSGSIGGGVIQILEATVPDEEVMLAADEWIDVEFEVALDSGSTDNVCHAADAPGYSLAESSGSKRGQTFTVGDGSKISNLGQFVLNLQGGEEGGNNIATTFQVAKVTRPLMSVGRICDNEMDVLFSDTKAKVIARSDGATVCTFERQNGGLYLAKFRLKKPDFGRQG